MSIEWGMVYRASCMGIVYGVSRMVNGAWGMEYGVWGTSQWGMEYRASCMVHRAWGMGHGEWGIVNGE